MRQLTQNNEPRPVKRPRQLKHPNLSPAEHLFVWLYGVIGYTIAESYKISHSSSATLNSCSAMGSRLLKSEYVREYLEILDRYYENYHMEIKIKLL